MQYFLVKADPQTDYSIADLARDGSTPWEGVHNFQAINHIKTMRPGDRVFVYHSQKQKAIVGMAKVAGQPYQNTADPRPSWAVHLAYVCTFARPLSLENIKAAAATEPALNDFALVRNSRLSVMLVPSTVLEWLRTQLPLPA